MVLKNLEKYNLILASASPRRQQLMKDLGLTFEVKPADVDEFYPENLGMTAIPEYLAQLKADALNGSMGVNDLIITADTIVWKDDKVLGKPSNQQEAVDMLKSLSGSQHQVITGMHLQSKSKKISFHAVTEVWFDELTDDEINFYIDKYKPFDKAGAYGIQEWIGFVGIYKIEGSFYNVMGLPIHKLYQYLKEF
ncbi:Maf-like protein [Mangrovibacterium diazotrophicum]|uniref:dTTP/UTP pyrophosphatase n=1 Tax=Mangrovibacterium diazotrophicum TaxID=1261403 RepID=A0A419VVX9_9BACT|nr:Maf-like protein [Mangrovibacterium diazotrophicum]RKD86303.1 septum formation protein [Mangrovibacterium diazotrophicum]